jgi:class 3 adenylate cyclase
MPLRARGPAAQPLPAATSTAAIRSVRLTSIRDVALTVSDAQKVDIPRQRGDVSNRPVAALGAKASDFETRKLAAILAVDIVGFSRLTGADEDRTLASQPRC